MKTAGRRRSSGPTPADLLTELRARLDESEAALHAIRTGGVDALVVAGQDGPRVFTLEGAEDSYRVLIESMHEGALMLSADALILYANRRFAAMTGRPLSRVLGASFRDFLAGPDQEALTRILRHAARPASTLQVFLRSAGASPVPAQVSIRRLSRKASRGTAFSVVVIDMSEASRSERTLRSLSHSLLRTQETDRRRLARELHDRATEGLSALLIRLHLLGENLPERAVSLRAEVIAIADLVGRTADMVEGISKALRPSVLEILGLVPALRAAAAGFAKRTGIAASLACSETPLRLSAEAELVLYRVLEEALRNVQQHAGARHVVACLRRQGTTAVLSVRDDGVGFDADPGSPRPRPGKGIGLIGLRERVAYVGGTLEIVSFRGAGTELAARVPLVPFGAPETRTGAGAADQPAPTVPEPRSRVPRRTAAATGPRRPR